MNYAHTLCHTHYCQKRRGVELKTIVPRRGPRVPALRDAQGRKHCPKCDLWLDVTSFNHGAKGKFVTSDGLSTQCKSCRRAYMHTWKYGLTVEQVTTMIHDQGGACATCPAPLAEGYAVDHDHACCDTRDEKTCGKCARGLLCRECNWVIGMLERKPESVSRWLAYIEERV